MTTANILSTAGFLSVRKRGNLLYFCAATSTSRCSSRAGHNHNSKTLSQRSLPKNLAMSALFVSSMSSRRSGLGRQLSVSNFRLKSAAPPSPHQGEEVHDFIAACHLLFTACYCRLTPIQAMSTCHSRPANFVKLYSGAEVELAFYRHMICCRYKYHI